MVILGGYWVGTGMHPSTHPPGPHTPGTPPRPATPAVRSSRAVMLLKEAVGLKSVAQLSLSDHFSDLRGFTEVHNLVKVGNR